MLSAKILLDQSLEIYKKRLKVFLGIMAVPVIVLLLSAFLIRLCSSFLSSDSPFFESFGSATLILGAVLTLGGIIIQLWSQTALLCSVKDREENIGIKESYRRGWNKIIPYFWISLLSGFIIMVGFFLFIIPGLIFFIWFSLSSFVLISENKKGWSALVASKNYARGNLRALFWRFLFIVILAWLFLFLLNFLTSFVSFLDNEKIYFYISYALLTPMVTIYLFLIYENLKKLNSSHSVI